MLIFVGPCVSLEFTEVSPPDEGCVCRPPHPGFPTASYFDIILSNQSSSFAWVGNEGNHLKKNVCMLYVSVCMAPCGWFKLIFMETLINLVV